MQYLTQIRDRLIKDEKLHISDKKNADDYLQGYVNGVLDSITEINKTFEPKVAEVSR